ncbi:hypothetical protein EZ428_23805 [Pedobacter frigiditerrae]|uniref:Uncharacterized protein n=1 Tax=Pedobacter frigiditerrae TaxID=2530452 RepID=A0A4R0MIT6_9SPHI|nr:hypothetical protein [Pedobacter frigiditerrae]TCC86491.1 hypothetical protein EZ428_23805 [Pedobacter frigiditerrae]
MRSEYQKAVLDAYQKKKSEGLISINLIGLSPGQLGDECINVYKERPSDEDEGTLRSFFGSRNQAPSYTEIIENVDIDKFRPVKSFIVGKTTNPELRVVELLAWLIDFKPRPYPVWLIEKNPGKITLPPEPPTPKLSKAIITVLLIAFLGFAIYSYLNYGANKVYLPATTQEKCMHWTGNRYEPISCAAQTSTTPIIGIDFQKLNHFKKINTPDKLTKYDLGKVWYAKIYRKVEFYTDSGMHPIDTNRVLRPLTDYMLKTHTSYYRYLLNLLFWALGGIGLLWLLVIIARKYLVFT